MPRKTSQSNPPEVMTWGKATPVLIVAGVFDALRFMCEWLIFFGPALAGLACTAVAGGTTAAGVVCGAGAAAGGFFGAAFIGPFGMIMAEATGLTGWLIIGGWLVRTNMRIFKENALWFGGSLLLSEIPFVGGIIPAFTAVIWKMYGTQIKVEKAAYKKWEKENAAAQRQEQQRQLMAQSQVAQRSRAEQQSALDAEWEGELAQQEAEKEEQQVADEQEQIEQQEQEIPGPVAQIPIATNVQQRPVSRPEIKASPPLPTQAWSPDSGTPPPLTPEYGYRTTPPPLPPEYLRSIPPPIPTQPPPLPPIASQSTPPPLPEWARAKTPPPPPLIGVPNYASIAQPPPLPLTEPAPQLGVSENAQKESETLNIPIIDRGLMDLGIAGPEKMTAFLNEKKNLSPDASIYLYHGLNGGLGKALSLLESPEQGLKQISGPALAVFPVGQFWKPGDAGLRYSISRGQIEFPGEHNPTAQFQLDDKGVVFLRNGLDTLPLNKFEGEVMRTEGKETHQEWREINGRSKRVDVETVAPLTDKEIEVGRKIEEKMKEFSSIREKNKK